MGPGKVRWSGGQVNSGNSQVRNKSKKFSVLDA